MLHDTSAWLLMTVLAMMAAVLCYAINTLYGMNRKVVYPLLRVRLKEGGYSTLIIPKPSPSGELVSLLCAGV